MKTMIITLLSFFLIISSFSAQADKILLTGKPVILLPEESYYTFPKDYTPVNNYHFVNVGGVNRVCFLDKVPEIVGVDMLRLYILQHERKYIWYCYRYDSRYFTMNF